jgi:AcrR family transcriptional regulator
MTKGDITRETILEKAVTLFNVYGYSGTSLKDIMDATGLQKGGIYNHFESKEALAVAAFDYAMARISDLMVHAIRGKRDPLERLDALIGFFEGYFEKPPIEGGCMLLNTAVESDDAYPVLREHARHWMSQWRELIRRTVDRGIERGKMRPTLVPDEVATLVIGTLEGAMMLSKLYDDATHIDRAVVYLRQYVDTQVRQS